MAYSSVNAAVYTKERFTMSVDRREKLKWRKRRAVNKGTKPHSGKRKGLKHQKAVKPHH